MAMKKPGGAATAALCLLFLFSSAYAHFPTVPDVADMPSPDITLDNQESFIFDKKRQWSSQGSSSGEKDQWSSVDSPSDDGSTPSGISGDTVSWSTPTVDTSADIQNMISQGSEGLVTDGSKSSNDDNDPTPASGSVDIGGVSVDVASILGKDPTDTFEDPVEWLSDAADPSVEGKPEAEAKGISNDYTTNFKGAWEVVKENAGVSAMHLVVLPNNKVVMFDSTVLGPSQLPLPKGYCRFHNNFEDCWAHAGEFDIDTGDVRPLRVLTDTWCSSGAIDTKGRFVQAGGWNDGGKAVRYLELCDTCDFKEYPISLSGQRWYSTQQVLPDGSFIVVGGRGMMNYEFIPAEGKNNPTNFALPFLQETTDNIPGSENNLYPHVHLSSDGNLFIFANYKAILLDPKANKVIRRYPDLPGGARCYPGSASSAVLPIKLSTNSDNDIPIEVAICGGAPKESYQLAETKKQLIPALKSCGRIRVTEPNAKWKIEQMPAPRVMGDMLILPTGDLLLVNGAKLGCSGWEFADDPYFSPVLYRTMKPKEERFLELAPTTIARMYHSTSGVLPDGRILVVGSSTHNGYKYAKDNVKFPTELRVEKFSPPYLDPALAANRPVLLPNEQAKKLKYGQKFKIDFTVNDDAVEEKDLKITLYSPAFTTHGYSMNQRLLVLAKHGIKNMQGGKFEVSLTAPPHGRAAPPGYYMLFAVHRGLPSKSIWVLLNK